MKRKIAVITTSRADYGHLYWPLRDLSENENVDLKIIALGSHLSPEFGNTFQEIVNDGFTIDSRIECLLSSDTDVGMAKTIGMATLGLADLFGQMRPDLLLLIADRYEMLAPASVALALRIPIAHIEGGEVSEGAIDDAVRNALTKMSHIHFTSTHAARERVIAMGEEEWRVHRAGAPSLDQLAQANASQSRASGGAARARSPETDRPSGIPSDDHRPRHAARSGRIVRSPGKSSGPNLVLLPERRRGKQGVDRPDEVIHLAPRPRKNLHQSRLSDLFESPASGRYVGWELK